mmetsp:Transcript_72904/g.213874  ORF Transcript_72904/g.213874 Transcript_72904/m.213874 type:complete len:206 (+) Transcript_72904:281-898(+)
MTGRFRGVAALLGARPVEGAAEEVVGALVPLRVLQHLDLNGVLHLQVVAAGLRDVLHDGVVLPHPVGWRPLIRRLVGDEPRRRGGAPHAHHPPALRGRGVLGGVVPVGRLDGRRVAVARRTPDVRHEWRVDGVRDRRHAPLLGVGGGLQPLRDQVVVLRLHDGAEVRAGLGLRGDVRRRHGFLASLSSPLPGGPRQQGKGERARS